MKKLTFILLFITTFCYSQKQMLGTTTINAGAKGDPISVKTINGESIEGVGNIVVTGTGAINVFTATSIADLENVANLGKIASITSEIDLETATVTLQKGMILQFDGGSFTNGTIDWSYNEIRANAFDKLFDETNLSHTGNSFAQDVFIEWFGAVADGVTYINSKAGNDIVATFGVTPFDRANEYMNTCKSGVLVFSDKTANYYVNTQDPDDGDTGTQAIFGLNYTASNTQIRIEKGVTIHANPCNHNWFTLLALNNVNNVRVYGGGALKGNFDTHTGGVAIDNGIGLQTVYACEDIIIEDLDLYDHIGDGYNQKIRANGDYTLLLTPESGGLDASGVEKVDSELTRSGYVLLTDPDHTRLGYTRIQNGASSGYDDTRGKVDVYFYSGADGSEVFISRELNMWFYERIPIPTGATKIRAVFHKNKLTYTDSNGIEQPDRIRLQPSEITERLTIQNCNIHNNSRNAISGTGGQNIKVLNNYIHDQGVSTTGIVKQTVLISGVDIEDYFLGNRYWNISGNTFKNNKQLDVSIYRCHATKIKNNTFLKSTDGYNSVIRWSSNGQDLKVRNNNIYGGAVYMRQLSETVLGSNEWSGNTYYNIQAVINGGYVHDEIFINSEIKMVGEDEIILSDILIKNDTNKNTDLSRNYSLVATQHANDSKIILRNITIQGNSPIRTYSLDADNIWIYNLTDNSSPSISAYIKAHYIDGLKMDWATLRLSSGDNDQNFIKNIEVQRLYIKECETSDVVITDSTFKNTVIDGNDNFIYLEVPLDKLYISNTDFIATTTSSTEAGSELIKGQSNQIGSFVFEKNNIEMITGIIEVLDIGTPTNPSILRGNKGVKYTLTGVANDIVEDNIIDGKSKSVYPVYADNAAAITGGLETGQKYITATGDFKVVY